MKNERVTQRQKSLLNWLKDGGEKCCVTLSEG